MRGYASCDMQAQCARTGEKHRCTYFARFDFLGIVLFVLFGRFCKGHCFRAHRLQPLLLHIEGFPFGLLLLGTHRSMFVDPFHKTTTVRLIEWTGSTLSHRSLLNLRPQVLHGTKTTVVPSSSSMLSGSLLAAWMGSSSRGSAAGGGAGRTSASAIVRTSSSVDTPVSADRLGALLLQCQRLDHHEVPVKA